MCTCDDCDFAIKSSHCVSSVNTTISLASDVKMSIVDQLSANVWSAGSMKQELHDCSQEGQTVFSPRISSFYHVHRISNWFHRARLLFGVHSEG
jgi:hypothetical protein